MEYRDDYQDGEHKQYSQEDSDVCDPQSRIVSADFLCQYNSRFFLKVPLEEQPNVYGDWDYEIWLKNKDGKGSKRVSVETEQKLGWISTDGSFLVASYRYPEGKAWPTVDVSHRKQKSIADLFIMVNATYNSLCMTEMQNVLDAHVRRKDTKIGTKNEAFYAVQKHLCKFFTLQDGIWQKVEG